MRTKSFAQILPLFAITLFFSDIAHATTEPCAVPPSVKAQVVQTIQTMYDAATKDDITLFNKVTTPDFYAFDGGLQYPQDAIMKLIKQLHAKGMVFVWTVNEPQVQIACNSNPKIAWITYINRGSVIDNSGTTKLQWLESAVLQKESGQWRIRFFHSTRVPPPEPQK